MWNVKRLKIVIKQRKILQLRMSEQLCKLCKACSALRGNTKPSQCSILNKTMSWYWSFSSLPHGDLIRRSMYCTEKEYQTILLQLLLQYHTMVTQSLQNGSSLSLCFLSSSAPSWTSKSYHDDDGVDNSDNFDKCVKVN